MYLCKTSCVRRGFSQAVSPAAAARELHDSLYQPDLSLVVFFCSTEYDLTTLERELKGLFGDVPLIGCTSAGEITPGGYLHGAIAGFSLSRPDFASAAAPLRGLSRFTVSEGEAIVRSLHAELDANAAGLPPENTFAFLLIDGLCKREEVVLNAIHAALEDVPLFGGSSGGGLNFKNSFVFDGGRFNTDAAVLVMVRTRLPFRLFTVDHFTNAATKMVVTEADPASRVVSEINAEPAGREYARLVGLEVNKLTPMIFARHPVVVRVGSRYYTRSIQRLNEDESLTFFCAIDKGIVLTVAKPTDLLASVRTLFDEIKVDMGTPQLVIGCDCILRALELEQRQQKNEAGRLMADNNVIGFSTFGEQFQAMHVNQTFTGAAIGTAWGRY